MTRPSEETRTRRRSAVFLGRMVLGLGGVILGLQVMGTWAAVGTGGGEEQGATPAQNANVSADSPALPTLTPQDRADLARVEVALDNLKAFQANFDQTDENGSLRTGTIALQRPGKMRVTYAPPDKDFMVADGHFVHFWDSEMGHQSSVPLDSSPASLLLQDTLRFGTAIRVVGLTRLPGLLEVTLDRAEDPASGSLTLVFEDGPLHLLQLRQWRLQDAAGNLTTVTLRDVRKDVVFPRGTFLFTPPNLGKSKD